MQIWTCNNVGITSSIKTRIIPFVSVIFQYTDTKITQYGRSIILKNKQ